MQQRLSRGHSYSCVGFEVSCTNVCSVQQLSSDSASRRIVLPAAHANPSNPHTSSSPNTCTQIRTHVWLMQHRLLVSAMPTTHRTMYHHMVSSMHPCPVPVGPTRCCTFFSFIHSFIHVTPVAEAHLSNASPFQTPLITPNNKLIKPTNKDNFLPG
jgi:hypothetical protein